MKLWHVQGTVDVDVVFATEGDEPPSSSEMRLAVDEEFSDNVGHSAWLVDVVEIETEKHLPQGWDVHCEAYGNLDETNVGHILDAIVAKRKALQDEAKNEHEQVKIPDVE